jgi:hypothetical protein
MKMSRRNVLAGLGGLAVGGGALLGSGAFSSVEATRDVEVNILDDIADSDAPDVLLNVGEYDEIAVEDTGGTVYPDGSSLSPDSDLTSSALSSTVSGNLPYSAGDYVSLVENDVKIVFGYEDGTDDFRLPPSSTVTFDDLILMVQETSTNGGTPETDLAFGTDVNSSGLTDPTGVEFVNDANPLGNVGNTSETGYPENVVVDDNSDQEGAETLLFDVSVTTGTSDDSATDEFGIALGSNASVSDLLST